MPIILNMLLMKRFLFAACLLLASVSFTACTDDDDSLFDTLTGRVWAGDLGFWDGRYPLDSYILFEPDGFGSDELYYADNGEYFGTLRIQWEAYDDGTIYINYGTVAPPRELRNVRIRHGRLTADLYIDGWYGHITLYMQ